MDTERTETKPKKTFALDEYHRFVEELNEYVEAFDRVVSAIASERKFKVPLNAGYEGDFPFPVVYRDDAVGMDVIDIRYAYTCCGEYNTDFITVPFETLNAESVAEIRAIYGNYKEKRDEIRRKADEEERKSIMERVRKEREEMMEGAPEGLAEFLEKKGLTIVRDRV